MTTVSGDFELTMDELRAVARFVVGSAEEVLPVFEAAHPDDPRPRAAVDAAWVFIDGERRTVLQRTTSLDAHRAAADAASESTTLAARAAGDAASAAYLHPIAKAHQVGHVLRAAACAARIAEIAAGGDPREGEGAVAVTAARATHTVVNVLRRYPPAPIGRRRVDELMSHLDDALRMIG